MSTKQIEALKLALEALEQIDEAMPFPVAKLAQKVIREALADHTEQPLEMVAEQPAQQHIEHCIWARNGNTPCPHVQPAQQESEAVRAAWMAGYTEGEREAIEKEHPANVAAINTSSERVDKTEENVHEKPAQQQEQHQDWCASLTQMLTSMPPKPAPCNCKAQQQEPEPDYYICQTCGGMASDPIVPPSARQQEPVAWANPNDLQGFDMKVRTNGGPLHTVPLYTSPQPSKPWVGLTDEEVKHEWEVWRASMPRYAGFAKGIEAKLREKNA